jgi:hypothetical protein
LCVEDREATIARFLNGLCECCRITTLCGIGGHGPYDNEGGETNKKKRQYTFSNQFDFIFLNMEAESEERGGLSNQSLMQRPKGMLIWMGKVNLNLNLLVIEILNVLSV